MLLGGKLCLITYYLGKLCLASDKGSAMLKIALLMVLTACSTSSLRYAQLMPDKKRTQYEAFGEKYMIATQGAGASQAAKTVLDKGGNIYDAFVAATFAISVERPHSTGIGGGGFLVHHNQRENKTEAVDFREVAPMSSTQNIFLDKNGKQITDKSLTGPFAVAVPGLVAGTLEVHRKYGKLPLAIVMEPAIKMAEEGFSIYPALADALEEEAPRLKRFPSSTKIFFGKNNEPLQAGDLLVQTDLAKSLKLIRDNGRDGFYQGIVSSKIIATVNKYGGKLHKNDFKNYQVKYRKPVEGTYKDYRVVSMPPPSSGGTHVIQILNIVEEDNLKKLGAQSAKAIHLTASAMQIAFADRAKYMGDADFVKVPVKELTSKTYAKKLRNKIGNKALASKDFPIAFKDLYESSETTHFTIMDSVGNVISSTQTINGWFGSALVAEGTGIMLNNEMDDFASHVGGVNLFKAIGGSNNLVAPKKRPLSSMSPTIIFKQDKPYLALGTPSGTRILTCVAQTILNYIEHELPLYDAVSATRYHHQWFPEELWIEKPYLAKAEEEKLSGMGHKIKHKSLGCKIQAVSFKDGKLHGVSDPREEGMAIGL